MCFSCCANPIQYHDISVILIFPATFKIAVFSRSSCFSEDEADLEDDVPILIVGHHTHQDLGDLCDLDVWTPLLSHQLFKTLGRSMANHRPKRYIQTFTNSS